jgi:hypothetical protein
MITAKAMDLVQKHGLEHSVTMNTSAMGHEQDPGAERLLREFKSLGVTARITTITPNPLAVHRGFAECKITWWVPTN